MAVTFDEVKEKIRDYLGAREWLPLAPSDVAKSIMIEWAELLEHFQRDQTRREKNMESPPKDKEKIEKEVADLFIYLFEFCLVMDITAEDAIVKKLEHLEKKYPVDYAKQWKFAYDKIKQQWRADGKD